MLKYFFFFKPDLLIITKDAAGKNVIDSILYKSIKCINLLGQTSFYFKSNKEGYALFFKNHNPENAKKWFKYLIMCKEKTDEAKVDIMSFDLAEHVAQVSWAFKEVVYKFNYRKEIGDKEDLKTPDNPTTPDIWIPEIERIS